MAARWKGSAGEREGVGGAAYLFSFPGSHLTFYLAAGCMRGEDRGFSGLDKLGFKKSETQKRGEFFLTKYVGKQV